MKYGTWKRNMKNGTWKMELSGKLKLENEKSERKSGKWNMEYEIEKWKRKTEFIFYF
jgi:hypothetical protein